MRTDGIGHVDLSTEISAHMLVSCPVRAHLEEYTWGSEPHALDAGTFHHPLRNFFLCFLLMDFSICSIYNHRSSKLHLSPHSSVKQYN